MKWADSVLLLEYYLKLVCHCFVNSGRWFSLFFVLLALGALRFRSLQGLSTVQAIIVWYDIVDVAQVNPIWLVHDNVDVLFLFVISLCNFLCVLVCNQNSKLTTLPHFLKYLYIDVK